MVEARWAYRQLKQSLEEAGVPDAGFEADVLIEHVCGRRRFVLDALEDAQWAALQAMAQRRAAREPLQYILGRWPFLGLSLRVGPGVLIPRPETEEVCLVAEALAAAQSDAPVVLDLCAGSGALALGLKSRLPAARVTAVELSDEAYAYLAANVRDFAAAHPEGEPPRAVQADVFVYHSQLSPQTVDLIVSNPPYVTDSEYAALQPEIAFEPKMALVAAEEGLAFYKGIAQNYKQALKKGGRLLFEIGAGQGAAVEKLLLQNGYTDISIRQDMAQHDRMAIARKP